eukprot:TRINITY_DN66376_c12_g3_i2.p1 TRINITY_DN66376_c12_g3~~TRINITY_DN66376_c12_g3_i2.p1  ORF type:complete len:310 (-),score=0.67 TRINITY_DN66376_c12_g3_i2:61-990(-)
MEIAYRLDPPLKFEIHRIPYLLEHGYDESESFSETHLERMKRLFDGDSGYGEKGYENFKKGCQMNNRARQVGLSALSEGRICGNTIRSHCLAHHVNVKYGWKMCEKLFDKLTIGHFQDGKNLNNTEFLLKCYKEAGLDVEEAKEILSTKKYRDVVLTTVNNLLKGGLDHIPVFIINNSYILDGAPTANTFISLFRKLESEIMEKEEKEKYKIEIPSIILPVQNNKINNKSITVPIDTDINNNNNNNNNLDINNNNNNLDINADIFDKDICDTCTSSNYTTSTTVTPPVTPPNELADQVNVNKKRKIIEI